MNQSKTNATGKKGKKLMKNVIITGCAKGLGLEISTMLASAGYRVLGISRTLTEEYQQLQLDYPESVFFTSLILQM
ncbi:SDR family NAD(P)-dependent oxidoreductase [Vibrio sinaloensis]|nr:SDR family NAD(P)-dependent oxidoreductase [Vibrio sinaloensis]